MNEAIVAVQKTGENRGTPPAVPKPIAHLLLCTPSFIGEKQIFLATNRSVISPINSKMRSMGSQAGSGITRGVGMLGQDQVT